MEPPEEFPFPFPPYPIQADFMKNLYTCLENGKLGIFESPTGTGKTLAIICGAIKWLIDHEERQKNCLLDKRAELDRKIKDMDSKHLDDWFSIQTEQIEVNLEKQSLQKKLDLMAKHEEKLLKYKERVKQHRDKRVEEKKYFNSKWKNAKGKSESGIGEGEDVPAKDEVVDEELVLKDIDYRSDSSEEEECEETTSENCKIFFCSRTHSQLSQFVGELKKSPYSDKVSLVPLASR